MTQLAYQFLAKLQTRNLLVQQFLIELVGTFILIVLIDNAVATYTFGSHADHFAIATAAGIGLYLAVIYGATVSAGHVNPVVTLALATLRRCPWKSVPVYFLGQFLGGLAAAIVSFANQKLNIVLKEGVNVTSFSRTSGLFMSSPGVRPVDHGTVILDQILCVGILMFAIMALVDKTNDHNSKKTVPFGLLFILIGVILSFGTNAGAAINPARDIPARIFAHYIGYINMFNDLFWLTGSTIGPFLGAIIGGWFYYLTVEIHRVGSNEKGNSVPIYDLNLHELVKTLDKFKTLAETEEGLKGRS